MSVPEAPQTHRAHLEAVLREAENLQTSAARAGTELSEDGAQPHLIAALNALESALGVERRRLAVALDAEAAADQQALAL